MEKISNQTKARIAVDLKNWVDKNHGGSANKASTALKVSNATISNIIREQFDSVSDEMFRKIEKQVTVVGGWLIAKDTRGFVFMEKTYSRAAKNSEMLAIKGGAGRGKTEVSKQGGENYFVIRCHEYFTPRTFLEQILKVLGKRYQGQNLVSLMDSIVDSLLKLNKPLLVFDEADKLNDKVLYFLISFYNMMEGKCGIIMQATGYLEQRIDNGYERGKKGYEEIISRIGRVFLALPDPDISDVTKIMNLNGIYNQEKIVEFFNQSGGDLRVIKKKAQAYMDLKMMQSA